MRKFLTDTLFFSLFFSCGIAYAASDVFYPERGIGHSVLAIESVVGATPSDQEPLERLVEDVVTNLRAENLVPRDVFSVGDAGRIFFTIERYLRDTAKLKIAKQNDGQLYLFRALRDNYWDCDTLSFLYLAIGERLGLPIRGVAAPSHMFVRWEGGGWSYNWDPRRGGSYGDRRYMTADDIAKESVVRGFLLTSLSRVETMSVAFYNVAYGIVEKGTKEECLRVFPMLVRSLALWPKHGYAHDLSSWCRLIREEPVRALEDAGRALELEPFNHLAHRHKAQALIALGRGEEEVARLDRVIEANDNAADAYYLRGYIRYFLDRPGIHEGERARFSRLADDDLKKACDRTVRFCMAPSRYFR